MANDEDRFAELVRNEFGVAVDKPGVDEDRVHKEQAKAHRRDREQQKKRPAGPDWFSLDAAIAQAEPDYEPWEQFHAPKPPPLRRPRQPKVIIGLCAFGVALVIAVLWMAGVGVPVWLRGVGGGFIGVGLVFMLLAIPRHRDRLGDGAVI